MAELARGMLLRRLGGEPLSVAALLDSLDVDPAAREAVRSRVEVSSAHGADEVDARVLGHFGSSYGGPESDRIVEGNDAIARGLAAGLGDRLHLSTPAESIAWDARRRCASTPPRGEWIADYAHRRGAGRRPEDAAVRARPARRQARRAGAPADRDGREAVRAAHRAHRAVRDAVGAGALLGVDGARRRRRRDARRELLRRARPPRVERLRVGDGPGHLGGVAAAAAARPGAGRGRRRPLDVGRARGRSGVYAVSSPARAARRTRRRSAAARARSSSAASTPPAATAG